MVLEKIESQTLNYSLMIEAEGHCVIGIEVGIDDYLILSNLKFPEGRKERLS